MILSLVNLSLRDWVYRAANLYDFDRIHTIFASKYGDTVYNKNSTISRKSGRISVILWNIDICGKNYANPEKNDKKKPNFFQLTITFTIFDRYDFETGPLSRTPNMEPMTRLQPHKNIAFDVNILLWHHTSYWPMSITCHCDVTKSHDLTNQQTPHEYLSPNFFIG